MGDPLRTPPTQEELAAALQAQYGLPPLPAMTGPVPPIPAPVSPPPAMIGGPGAELPPGSVAPPGAPQAPQSGIAYQPPAPPPGPPTEGEILQDVANRAVADLPSTNADAAILQKIPSGSNASAAGGGIAYLPTQSEGISQTKMSPKAEAALKAFQKYTGQAASANAVAGLAEADRDRAVSAQIAATADEMQVKNREYEAMLASQDARREQLQLDVDQKRKVWSSAANEEYKDPRSPFARVVGALAAGLGAFGAALTHTENWAQKTLDNQFERSYGEWKRGIAAKREGVTLSQQIMNETSTMFTDQRAAKMAARGLWLEQAGAALQKANYVNKDEITKTRALQQTANIIAAGQQFVVEAYGQEAIHVQTGTSTAPVATGAAAGTKQRTALDDLVDRAKGVEATNTAFGPDPTDKEEAKQIRKDILGTMPMILNVQKLSDMIDGFSPADFASDVSDKKTAFNSRVEKLSSDLIQAASGTGVPVEEKLSRLRGMVGAGKWTASGMKAALKEYSATLAEINKIKANSVHKQLREDLRERLTGTLPRHMSDAIWAGEVPGGERTVQEGTALGGTNAR